MGRTAKSSFRFLKAASISTSCLPKTFGHRRIVVGPRSIRHYWIKSLSEIHRDLFAAVDLWVGKDALVWDVGANLGVFGLAAAVRAGLTGKVYCFEPIPSMAALLAKSLIYSLKDQAEICICPFAIGSSNGTARFVISGYRTAASALEGFGRFARTYHDEVCTVPVFTLDALTAWLQPPTILKIDVEGAARVEAETLICSSLDHALP